MKFPYKFKQKKLRHDNYRDGAYNIFLRV